MPAPATPTRCALPAAAAAPAPLARWAGRWRERRAVARVSREMLRLHDEARATWPHLHGRDLYAAMLGLRRPGDATSPEDLLQRAAESFAAWPVERALTLRDVVHYLVVRELLTGPGRPAWTQGRLGSLVGVRIPADL